MPHHHLTDFFNGRD